VSLRIPRPLIERIRAEAEKAYPGECCGLLAGTDAPSGDVVVSRVATSGNVAAGGRADRFEVDPMVRLGLMRELGEIGGADDPGAASGERIVGHYHSHPDHPPEPSAHDLEMAFEPDLLWLIVAVADGMAGPVKAHAVSATDESGRAMGFQEIAIRETETTP